MEGYSGNWLDRDLSATEKQHVGLSMFMQSVNYLEYHYQSL